MGLWKVSASGGTPQVVTTPDAAAGENSHRWVDLLPDGEHALITIRTQKIDSFDQAKIGVVSLKDGKWTTILDGGAYARYVEPGMILFTRASGIYAAPFDPVKLKITGPAENVLEGVTHYPYTGGSEWSVSKRGDLVYQPGASMGGRTEFDLRDRTGASVRHLATVGDTGQWSLSPDGTKVAITISAANDDVWVEDLERGTLTRLTFDPGDEGFPVWTRDGRSVMYPRGDRRALLKRAADGTGTAEMLLDPKALVDCGSVAPDGKTMAITMVDPEKGSDIWLLPLDGKREPKLFIQTPFEESWPRFSPDGRWLAYASNESGRYEVYITGMNGEGRWQVSNGGGDLPEWSPLGNEIVFTAKDKLCAASIASGQKLAIGKPVELFDIGGGLAVPAVDGKGFIVSHSAVDDSPHGVGVVVNWMDELKRRGKAE
jgi:dipeptidyl aminopeptidase/acylaminoacyl peptidase